MDFLAQKIEAALFLLAKPVSVRRLASVFQVPEASITEVLDGLVTTHNTPDSALHLLEHNGEVQLVTNPAFAEVLSAFTKEEVESELTRPQLETLTIVAYRGPITKPEIEQIRGVNCSLILRNLAMRGLVEEKEDSARLQPVYTVSGDFLRALGAHAIEELPDYEALHTHAKINQLIDALPQEEHPGV
jgi:segregation and condensation protein B